MIMMMKWCMSQWDEFDKDWETAIMSYVSKNNRWIIDSGWSHHITGDKGKFFTLAYYDGNCIRFSNDAPYLIKGKGSINRT